jgi:ATP-dependent Clp protease ATP-binding subunit ClpC
MPCVGATTLDEFRQHIERDAALERPVPAVMRESSLRGGNPGNFRRACVAVTSNSIRFPVPDGALAAAARLADRYISDQGTLPDKAIDLIDEAGSQVKLRFTPRHLSKAVRTTTPPVERQAGRRHPATGL